MGLKLVEKLITLRLFPLLLTKLFTDLLQHHPADIAVDAFAVLFGAVFNELAAALGEGHVDPVIFVVGANPRIGILFLAMGSPRRYHSTDRTKCPLCNDTLHGDTMYHYIKRRDPLGKWKNYCVLGDFVL